MKSLQFFYIQKDLDKILKILFYFFFYFSLISASEPNTIDKDWKKVLGQAKNLDFNIDNRIDSREKPTSILPDDVR